MPCRPHRWRWHRPQCSRSAARKCRMECRFSPKRTRCRPYRWRGSTRWRATRSVQQSACCTWPIDRLCQCGIQLMRHRNRCRHQRSRSACAPPYRRRRSRLARRSPPCRRPWPRRKRCRPDRWREPTLRHRPAGKAWQWPRLHSRRWWSSSCLDQRKSPAWR